MKDPVFINFRIFQVNMQNNNNKFIISDLSKNDYPKQRINQRVFLVVLVRFFNFVVANRTRRASPRFPPLEYSESELLQGLRLKQLSSEEEDDDEDCVEDEEDDLKVSELPVELSLLLDFLWGSLILFLISFSSGTSLGRYHYLVVQLEKFSISGILLIGCQK